ncbi:LTA synthase family protein [Falsibacillus pallidus]|uniref:Phosphoglycerol transferase MdoB-like AlkP superfamily enzyme n=1 Tax=Falsibacillus pallidus TaxID=493781 RepID=A0A370GJY9_9BACI|nr:LTA synthase family protein [Falsibacillus pallidus]RDI43947.1 phosphoglycerol transferase MdoB-like AlkP superfamily enzyme [Falsibacillus pallidus]
MNKKNSPMPFVIIGAVLMWIKTYIAYKTSFNMKIDDPLQEFILLINPLSFLLIIFSLALFMEKEKNQKIYIIGMSGILTFILYANIGFYRFFNDFLTLPVLFQTNNFGELGSSMGELLHWTDIAYFMDVVILCAILNLKPNWLKFNFVSKVKRKGYYLFAGILALVNLSLAEIERPQLLTRSFDREMLVKNIGTYNYHLYDLFLQSKSSAQRAMADGSKLADIQNYVMANKTEPDPELFGIAKGRNLIIVSMESMQGFVIHSKINGKEVTPFLNSLIKDSYYFDHFYHQTGQGKTSDAEFLIENSLFPLGRGAVFFTHSGNQYESLAKRLGQNGYYTAAMHANNKSFWNRDLMYKSLDYNRYYSSVDYKIRDGETVGWGMKDIPFFAQSTEMMQKMPQPFYTKLITLTNHHPFKLDPEDRYIDEFTSNDGTVNRYFTTVRYTDEALKQFFAYLKEKGLYENSIILLYGDHYGISENHNAAMAQFLGEEITPFKTIQLQRVPLFLIIPGVTDMGRGKIISKVSGQIDIRPTLLHLLGLPEKNDMEFGTDIFSKEHEDFVVLRNGSFITDKLIYANSHCYEKNTELQVDPVLCDPYKESAKTQLDYSDQIIYGDLLRFYHSSN